jgi:hypothetical protein
MLARVDILELVCILSVVLGAESDKNQGKSDK